MDLEYKIREDLGELPPRADEKKLVERIIEANEQMLPRGTGDVRFAPGMRAQHPKAQATVAGEFEVIVGDDTPEWAKQGLFKQPGNYSSQARFSNSRRHIDNPKDGDAHGLAIRIIGPEEYAGRQYVGAGEPRSLDFVLMDNETFFEGDLKKYAWINDRAAEIISNRRNGDEFILSKLNVLSLMIETKIFNRDLGKAMEETSDQFPHSPLATSYFSTTPYLLGDVAVKYELRPLEVSEPKPNPPERTKDYLGEQLFKGLKASSQIFGFYCKKQRSKDLDEIEDPTAAWGEKDENNDDVLVAKLTLSKINHAGAFEDWHKETMKHEDAGYNIWNTIPEHRPLGGINRVRRHIYTALQEKRRALAAGV